MIIFPWEKEDFPEFSTRMPPMEVEGVGGSLRYCSQLCKTGILYVHVKKNPTNEHKE